MTDDNMISYRTRTNHKNYVLNVLEEGPYDEEMFRKDDIEYIVDIYEDTIDALSYIETDASIIHNMFVMMITSWMGITLLNKEVINLKDRLSEYEDV